MSYDVGNSLFLCHKSALKCSIWTTIRFLKHSPTKSVTSPKFPMRRRESQSQAATDGCTKLLAQCFGVFQHFQDGLWHLQHLKAAKYHALVRPLELTLSDVLGFLHQIWQVTLHQLAEAVRPRTGFLRPPCLFLYACETCQRLLKIKLIRSLLGSLVGLRFS